MRKDQVLNQLREQGFKLTGKRKSIVEILLKTNRYLSVKELMDQLLPDYPRLSIDTVYRNLNLLRQEKIIEESEFGEGGARYRIRCSSDHHHHAVCVECGRTEPLHDCPMELMHTVPAGFHVLQHRFEVLGLCADCQTNEKA